MGARGYAWSIFDAKESGAWVRVKADKDCRQATAFFQYSNADPRPPAPAPIFSGLARPADAQASGGLLWTRGDNKGALLFAAGQSLYELDADLKLRARDDPKTAAWMRENLAPPAGVLAVDGASAIFADEDGKRWRLPKGDPAFDRQTGLVRVSREVSTERDLFNAHGTFYELPALNAGGTALIRPIATHNLAIRDYCSWRGLTVLSGVANPSAASGRMIRSDDGRAGLWLGVSDDLWQLGKPRGDGGPWKDTPVKAQVPSDPYLMTGYDEKTLRLSHRGPAPVKVRVEVDLTGMGLWQPYATFDVPAGKSLEHCFPTGFSAYWVRTVALADATATAQLAYR